MECDASLGLDGNRMRLKYYPLSGIFDLLVVVSTPLRVLATEALFSTASPPYASSYLWRRCVFSLVAASSLTF